MEIGLKRVTKELREDIHTYDDKKEYILMYSPDVHRKHPTGFPACKKEVGYRIYIILLLI